MEGYKRELHLFSLRNINIVSLMLFIISFIGGSLINLICTDSAYLITGSIWWDVIIAFAILLVGLFAHEGLHGLTAIIIGKSKPSDIKFGIKLKEGLLFCHSEKPMTVNAYRTMLLIPVLVTGVIPLIVSIICGNVLLIAAFSLLIAGGAGDICMFIGLVKNHKGNELILDHANTVAYYKLYKEGEEPEGFVETTPEEEEKAIEEMAKQEVLASKKTVWIKIVLIVIFLMIMVLGFYLIARVLMFI